MRTELPRVSRKDAPAGRNNERELVFDVDDRECRVVTGRDSLMRAFPEAAMSPQLRLPDQVQKWLSSRLKGHLLAGRPWAPRLRMEEPGPRENVTDAEWTELNANRAVCWAPRPAVRMAILERLYDRLEAGQVVTEPVRLHRELFGGLDPGIFRTSWYYLKQAEYLTQPEGSTDRATGQRLTAKGIDAVERWRQLVPGHNVGFGILAFSPDTQELWSEAVAPAFRELGLAPVRVDAQALTDPVITAIHRYIRDADLVIADLTSARPNCYYEVGVAKELGKPLLLTARTLDDVHFDTRAFQVHLWDNRKFVALKDHLVQLGQQLLRAPLLQGGVT